MKGHAAAFFLLFLLTLSAAQDTKRPDCPSITVTGPSGIIDSGDDLEFSASVSEDVPKNVRYFWSINVAQTVDEKVPPNTRPEDRWKTSTGRIVSGQGTLNLRVRFPENRLVQSLKATLRIEGLQAGCPSTASETYTIAVDFFEPVLFAEYRKMPAKQEREKLASAVAQGKEHPNDFLYIVMYFPTENRYANSRVSEVERFLTGPLKLKNNEFKILKVIDSVELTKIYFVLPGGFDPQP